MIYCTLLSRNSAGKITKAAAFQNSLPSGTQARVAPIRKWFGKFMYIQHNTIVFVCAMLGEYCRPPNFPLVFTHLTCATIIKAINGSLFHNNSF